MNIKIDKDGWLWIERAGIWTKQLCPCSATKEVYDNCGEWCPLFGESNAMGNILIICQARALMGVIIDERKRGEKDEQKD